MPAFILHSATFAQPRPIKNKRTDKLFSRPDQEGELRRMASHHEGVRGKHLSPPNPTTLGNRRDECRIKTFQPVKESVFGSP